MGGVTKAVEKVEAVGQNIINNPLPIVETALLTAALGPAGAGLGAAAAPTASAAVTYLNGGSVEDAAKSGAVSFAGQQAGQAYSPSVGTSATAPDNIDVGGGFNPATGAPTPTVTGLSESTEKAGVSGAASGATKAALKGGSASDIVTGGIVGGLSSAGGEAASEAAGFQPGSVGSTLTKTVVGQSIGDIFSPTRSSSTQGGGYTPQTSVTTTGAGQAPGSQALAQALRIGDPGAPIFGGEKDKEAAKQSGWNVESLRYMGQES